MCVVDEFFTLYQEYGSHVCPDEAISELEHALQTAEAARLANASAGLMTAFLNLQENFALRTLTL